MPELNDIATRIAGWARDGEQVEAYVARERETTVRVYDGGIESLTQADSEGVGIRLIVDGKQGFAYAGSLDEEVVKETLEEARDNASFGTPDEHAGLAAPDGVAPPELDLWRDSLATVPTSEKVDLAFELEKMVKAGDDRIKSIRTTAYSDALVELAIATSTGISATGRRTVCYGYATPIASDGDDTQTGYGLTIGREVGDLDLEEAARDAVDRAVRLLGAKKPQSAKLTVVFDPEVTSSFLSILASTLNGESVLKGRSMFADRVGEQVGASGLTLVEDPTNPLAFGSAQIDAEGLASRRVPLIEGGVLQGYLYNAYAARRAGTTSTASAVRGGFKSGPGVGARAISLVPGDKDQAAIIAGIEDGLLVQSVSGIHSGVNPISGDFSVGAEGIRIRGGELAEPVREMTIASTVQRMLQDVVEVGSDIEWLPGSAAGQSLAIADVSMGGA